MRTIFFDDIRLSDYTLENLSLLDTLRKNLLNKRQAICIERAKYYTEKLINSSSPEPAIIKRANALENYLSNKAPLFFDDDDNLLAGTTTSKPLGAPLYPEFKGLTIWPELDTISTREHNPFLLEKEEAEELNFNIFPYWMERSLLEYTRRTYHHPFCMRLSENIVFFCASKEGGISHTVPDYKRVLEKGLEEIINEASSKEKSLSNDKDKNKNEIYFYQAVQIVLKGIICYAQNLARRADELSRNEQNPEKKKNLQKMSNVCLRVPAKPAKTFREAINAIWIIQIAIHAENPNVEISPGRLDQVLYKYYRDDMDKGDLNVKEAMELVGCLWLKLNDNTIITSESYEGFFGGSSTVPSVTIGGIDEDGEDAVNDLTYIMLRITELLKIKNPNLNARYHYKKNTEEYLQRIFEVIANTKTVPSIHNDIENIKILKNQGVDAAHARDYAIIGCTGIASAGRSYDSPISIILNLVSVLELTLYNGRRPSIGDEQIGLITGDPSQFTTFEEFWEAFENQFKWLGEQAIMLNEYFGHTCQEILPTPLLSSFFEGPMEKGKDLINGGALYNFSGVTHIGFADTVDSLNAIETVFKDKKYKLSELLEALEADFYGKEKIHAYLINEIPKYGTDNEIAVKNSNKLISCLYNFYQNNTSYRGGKYRPGYCTLTHHAGLGRLSGALPNGRKAYNVFAGGLDPVSQNARDLYKCIEAIGKLESIYIPGGSNFNLRYSDLAGEEEIKRHCQLIEKSFKSGILNEQIAIMPYDLLLDAKRNPEKYLDLLVWVSGYPAYFKDLNEALKDEIITRTVYSINEGAAISFPEKYSSILSCK